MFDKLLGTVTFSIHGFDLGRLLDQIRSSFRIIAAESESDHLTVTVPYLQKANVLNLLSGSNCVYHIESEKGILRVLSKYKRRYGMILGLILGIVLAIAISQFVMKIDIVYSGETNQELTDDIIALLDECGLNAGAYIPNINFDQVESKLYSDLDDLGWISIGYEGSVVTVNVHEATLKTKEKRSYAPSNLIASRSGVIVDARVLAGQLNVTLGSAVNEGELLVDGIVESRNGLVYYYHSIGEIIAEFDDEYILRQDYVDVSQKDGKVYTTYSVQLFDFEVPVSNVSVGNYRTVQEVKRACVLGIQLPIFINKYTHTSIVEDIRYYTYDEANDELTRRICILEKGILKAYEILDKEIVELTDELGVTFIIKYKLRGDIAKQQPIFAK